MASRKKVQPEEGDSKAGYCCGGRSWQRKQEPHPPGKVRDVYCYRCKARMGCSRCCERERDLLCLECHNWASKIGVAFHGNVVPNDKAPRVRVDEGWITSHPKSDEVNRLVQNPPF